MAMATSIGNNSSGSRSISRLEDCFTCLRRTENFLCIAERDDVSGENVEAVFAKHFWFGKSDYQDRIVCTSCWEKIDDFHKFYCEVEKVHVPQLLAEIKTETIDCVGIAASDDPMVPLLQSELESKSLGSEDDRLQKRHVFVEAVCKLEEEVKEESDSDAKSTAEAEEDDEDAKSDDDDEHDDYRVEFVEEDQSSSAASDDGGSGSDSDVPLARRLAVRKQKNRRVVKRRIKQKTKERKEKSNNDEMNEFIRQHMDITCHKCTETDEGEGKVYESFYRLRVHFKKVHNTYAYVYCCNRKWSTKSKLVEHLTNHEPSKTDQKRCAECNCIFKDKNSYANHMFLVHTPDEEKQFKCDRCEKAFAAQDLLNSHIKWHEEVEKKNHYCEQCNKYFLSARSLENHNLSHHAFGESSTVVGQDNAMETSNELPVEEQPQDGSSKQAKKRTAEEIAQEDELIRKIVALNCSKCDFVGETFNKLSYHALKFHNITAYSVVCCDRRFSKKQRLYEHCLRHINPDHFKCDICGKTYADSSGLQIHKWWIHTPASERPFKCDICGAAFVKDYLLKQHTNWHVNKERKTHYCELCNKAYSNPQQLKSHQQKKHDAVSDWVCDICAKGFVHRALLEEHRLTHSEEGLASLKIQCEKCHKWLINKKSYLRHKRRCYDTNGPVKCDICGKMSINESALMGHKNFHHSNRPMFTCSFCGKECKTQLRLKEHEATHTGVVLYQCPYCPRTSNSSSNMYTHKKSAHPEKWAEEVAARFYTK